MKGANIDEISLLCLGMVHDQEIPMPETIASSRTSITNVTMTTTAWSPPATLKTHVKNGLHKNGNVENLSGGKYAACVLRTWFKNVPRFMF